MDPSMIIGVVLALGSIVGSLIMDGGDIGSMFLIPPMILVFGGTIGAVGGMFMAKFTGWVLDATGSYMPMFVIAGSSYLLALLVIHLLVPRMEEARLAES